MILDILKMTAIVNIAQCDISLKNDGTKKRPKVRKQIMPLVTYQLLTESFQYIISAEYQKYRNFYCKYKLLTCQEVIL